MVTRLDGVTQRPVKGLGVEYAMRAVERIQDSELDLVVVGTGTDEARLRSIGASINDAVGRRAIVFTGAMADPRPAYACADIVLGMGGSAARGLAFARPLIVVGEYGSFVTFRHENASDLFRASFWDVERPFDPPGELLRQLQPLLTNANERNELGRFGRVFAEGNFGLAAMTQRLAEVYEQALSGYGMADWLFDARMEASWLADKAVAGLPFRVPPRSAGRQRPLDQRGPARV
jgi:glycosyltransferase involved in cell wall biosynthesis